jgi:hypothetical protein
MGEAFAGSWRVKRTRRNSPHVGVVKSIFHENPACLRLRVVPLGSSHSFAGYDRRTSAAGNERHERTLGGPLRGATHVHRCCSDGPRGCRRRRHCDRHLVRRQHSRTPGHVTRLSAFCGEGRGDDCRRRRAARGVGVVAPPRQRHGSHSAGFTRNPRLRAPGSRVQASGLRLQVLWSRVAISFSMARRRSPYRAARRS